MDLLLFLILFPFLVAVALLLMPRDRVRKALGYLAGTIVIAASLFLLYSSFIGPAKYFEPGPELFNGLMLVGEVLIAAYIVYRSMALRKYAPLALAVAQTAILLYFEFGMAQGEGVHYSLFIDQLSLMMALIIGVVGGLICIYAFSYMEAFHALHKEVKDRRGLFFFVLFAFLSAMFGLVFSNSLLWLYFFWEVTTI